MATTEYGGGTEDCPDDPCTVDEIIATNAIVTLSVFASVFKSDDGVEIQVNVDDGHAKKHWGKCVL